MRQHLLLARDRRGTEMQHLAWVQIPPGEELLPVGEELLLPGTVERPQLTVEETLPGEELLLLGTAEKLQMLEELLNGVPMEAILPGALPEVGVLLGALPTEEEILRGDPPEVTLVTPAIKTTITIAVAVTLLGVATTLRGVAKTKGIAALGEDNKLLKHTICLPASFHSLQLYVL